MLEFLANVDPMSLPLWAVLLFAAGMYPVGMFLPCGRCCFPPCGTCEEGELPNTITVTFDGFPESSASPGPDLIHMAFSSCYGLGAEARVTAPGGDPDTDAGPISAVTVTNGGSGYAKLGRVEPSVAASGGSGTGATLTVTLSPAVDACGVDYWEVASVAVSGGTGYLDGDQLAFSVAEGDTVGTAATATIHTTRNEPTLTATASGGSGADLAITLNSDAGPPATWGVASIAVNDGGTGYTDGSPVTIALGSGDVQSSAAVATITTNRLEPTMAAATLPYSDGTGADLVATLGTFTGSNGKTYWQVTLLSIDAAGAGYQQYDTIAIAPTDGQSWDDGPVFLAYVDAVDENGAITAVAIYSGGAFYKDDGEIQSVEVTGSGEYYQDDGTPVSVSVESGGNFYREDASAPPYVATVTPLVSYQIPPSDGAGATFSAVVDDDPSSPTFGQVTSVTVDDGGDGYLAWAWVYKKHCCDAINGVPIVLRRNSTIGDTSGPFDAPRECTWSSVSCSLPAFRTMVKVAYLGPNTHPLLAIQSELCGSGYYTTETTITDCSDFSFTANGTFRGTAVTATVEPGGDYLLPPSFSSDAQGWYGQDNCFPCCKSADDIPHEITASFTGETTADYDGDYVLVRYESLGGYGGIADKQLRRWDAYFPGNPYPYFPAGFALSIEPCSSYPDTVEDRGAFYPITTKYGGYTYGWMVSDQETCNRCHKQCMTYAHAAGIFGLNVGTIVDRDGWFNPSNVGHTCDDLCQDTPICAPSPGDYVIEDFGTVTVL